MRVVAMIAAYNEERFIGACIEHLRSHGVSVYLIDNESTDQTVAIAERFLGRGVIGIERMARDGQYSWRPLLERKEQLALSLDADWVMHVDADEFRLPPPGRRSLAEALADVEQQGYNAVDFAEFAFVPTCEAPDHDHPQFQQTMRRYYPFAPAAGPNRLNAWKRQDERVELAWSGGHQVRFPGLRICPHSFAMRHYLFLSVPHAIRKYVERRYDPVEVANGWHRARAALRATRIALLPERELHQYISDDLLDGSRPRSQHALFAGAAAGVGVS